MEPNKSLRRTLLVSCCCSDSALSDMVALESVTGWLDRHKLMTGSQLSVMEDLSRRQKCEIPGVVVLQVVAELPVVQAD